MSGKKDYSKISLVCFGNRWGMISHICIMLYNTGVCIGFVVIYFDTLKKMLTEGFSLSNSNDCWVGSYGLYLKCGVLLNKYL